MLPYGLLRPWIDLFNNLFLRALKILYWVSKQKIFCRTFFFLLEQSLRDYNLIYFDWTHPVRIKLRAKFQWHSSEKRQKKSDTSCGQKLKWYISDFRHIYKIFLWNINYVELISHLRFVFRLHLQLIESLKSCILRMLFGRNFHYSI